MIKKRSVSQEAEGHTCRAKQTRLFKRKKVKKKSEEKYFVQSRDKLACLWHCVLNKNGCGRKSRTGIHRVETDWPRVASFWMPELLHQLLEFFKIVIFVKKEHLWLHDEETTEYLNFIFSVKFIFRVYLVISFFYFLVIYFCVHGCFACMHVCRSQKRV